MVTLSFNYMIIQTYFFDNLRFTKINTLAKIYVKLCYNFNEFTD